MPAGLRTYTREIKVNAVDRRYIEEAVERAASLNARLNPALIHLKRILLLDFPLDLTVEIRTGGLSS
jgi:hypothetical protein